MRLLHIGDIVGKPGRAVVHRVLPELIAQERIDFVVANGENVAGGSGIAPHHLEQLWQAGVDCITLGDHIYRQKQVIPSLQRSDRVVKPANFPPTAAGREFTVLPARNNVRVAVISLMGRVFMRPVDCPFLAADRILATLPDDVRVIMVDFHAEATSDKQLMGRFLDGRVSSVLGTHTHVTTADEQLFPGGTAFQCDVGMTGPHESIIGRDVAAVLETTVTFHPTFFDVARGDVRIHATLVDVDETTGRAQRIERIRRDMPKDPPPTTQSTVTAGRLPPM